MTATNESQLRLIVRDNVGQPSPFRAEWFGASPEINRVWSDSGEATFAVPSGAFQLLVRRGIDHEAVALDLEPAAGERLTREVVLKRRFDPRELGWYGGESHAHVIHGRSDDPELTIAHGAKIAAADGLEYVQFAWLWERTGAWLPTEELNRQCREASTPSLAVNWNIETPKCYMSKDDGGKSGNLHCYGHGWTVNLKDNSRGHAFFHTGPNFRILQEVYRQGGITGCAHPVRFWFSKGAFVSNWPSELPFDFVAGVPYEAVDILNDSPLLFFESERFWYTLLNLGYKVAGTGNSDACLEHRSPLGRYRTYAQIEGAFSWEKLAASIREGRCVASSGPFVQFKVDGQGPGAEFPADGKVRKATLKAWSSPLPGEYLTAVQLVRNGEVVRAWDLRAEKLRVWETSFDLRDEEFGWYCVRVLSNSTDPQSVRLWGPHLQELAVASPVYFLPAGFRRPAPEPARVRLAITDAETGAPVNATVRITNDERALGTEFWPAGKESALTVPATATLSIEAPGYEQAERTLYTDCPELHDYTRDIGTAWPSFFSPETYGEIRRRLANLKLSVALKESFKPQ